MIIFLLRVSDFPHFQLSTSSAAKNCLILIFNRMLDDIRLKFWPSALSVRGYRAFTLLAMSESAREAIPDEGASKRLTVAAGRTNKF